MFLNITKLALTYFFTMAYRFISTSIFILNYRFISTSTLLLICSVLNPTHANSCLASCLTASDYQHPSSSLNFSRNYFPDKTSLENTQEALQARWRHNFDIVITQASPQTTIFDQFGNRHVFNVNEAGYYIPLLETSGTLFLDNGDFNWVSNDGFRHSFQGSYLTEITSPDNDTLKLNYLNRQLRSVSNVQGETLVFNYRNNSIAGFTTPQGETVELTDHSCTEGSTTEPQSCDAEQHPITGFNSSPAPSGAIRIDARPASCESYFIDYFGTTRGSEIETGLATLAPYRTMQATVRSFPIIDFVNHDEWIAVRSRDLASPSFNDEQTPNALFYRLMRDGQEIQDRFLTPLAEDGFISVEEDGVTTRLEAGSESQSVVLQLVIRHQIASPSHWQQIDRARELLQQRYKIDLEVVIIP